MAYEQIYRLQAVNFEGENVIVHISDTTSGQVNPPTFHDMQLVALKRVAANDGEDKTGIRDMRISFSFKSTSIFNLNTFINGDDDRWMVEVFISNTSNIIFSGYLITDSTKEAFLPAGLHSPELTASFNLGILKEKPLRKTDDTVPRGKFKIIQFISWCLAGTGLDLTIKCAVNLFEEHYTGATQAIFDKIWLEAKTFEADINERESMYEVLRKIMISWGCFLTQHNGEWWIIRVDEMNDQPLTYYTFTSTGTFTGAATVDPVKDIGKNLSIKLINKNANVLPARRKKYAKQEFRFNNYLEVLCNMDFSRGSFNGIISVPPGYSAYNIECWQNARNYGGGLATRQAAAYIRRQFINGYETERVLIIPQTTIASHFVQAEDIDVNQGDKINFSVDRRLS
jgi:hypothetical protein